MSVQPSDFLCLLTHLFSDQRGYLALFAGNRTPRAKKLADVSEQFYAYPIAAGNAEQWLIDQSAANDQREVYVCAHLVTDRKRTKPAAAPITALWCDGDGATVPDTYPQPTAVVASSPGRYNYFWRLAEPAAPAVAEELNRAIARAIGADKSGYDLTQLLRAPGLPNRKYPDAPLSRLISITDIAYPIDQLTAAFPPAPAQAAPRPRAERATISADDHEAPVRLSEAGRRLWENADPSDRSGALWQIGCLLDEANASESAIAAALQNRDERPGWGKYTDRPAYYEITAHKIVTRERREQAIPILEPDPPPAPDTEPCSAERNVIAGLRAELAAALARETALKATLAEAQERFRLVLGLDKNPAIKAQRAVVKAVAWEMQSAISGERTDANGWVKTWLGGIGENAGVSRDRAGVHLTTMARDGLIEKRVDYDPEPRIDTTTGELRPPLPRLYIRPIDTVSDLLTRAAAWTPSPTPSRKKPPAGAWGGKREPRTDGRCEHHPEAGTLCAACRAVILQPLDSFGAPDLQDEGQGTAPTAQSVLRTFHLQDEGQGAGAGPETQDDGQARPVERRRKNVPDGFGECVLCGNLASAGYQFCVVHGAAPVDGAPEPVTLWVCETEECGWPALPGETFCNGCRKRRESQSWASVNRRTEATL